MFLFIPFFEASVLYTKPMQQLPEGLYYRYDINTTKNPYAAATLGATVFSVAGKKYHLDVQTMYRHESSLATSLDYGRNQLGVTLRVEFNRH